MQISPVAILYRNLLFNSKHLFNPMQVILQCRITENTGVRNYALDMGTEAKADLAKVRTNVYITKNTAESKASFNSSTMSFSDNMTQPGHLSTVLNQLVAQLKNYIRTNMVPITEKIHLSLTFIGPADECRVLNTLLAGIVVVEMNVSSADAMLTNLKLDNAQVMLHCADISNWKAVRKKQYAVQIAIPPMNTKVYNCLEQSNYVTDAGREVVIKGTVGEMWCTSLDKVRKTYEITDYQIAQLRANPGSFITTHTRVDNKAPYNWAFALPANVKGTVRTRKGTTLNLNTPNPNISCSTDVLIAANENGKPDFSNIWAVNAGVFQNTYEFITKAGR